MRKKRTPNSPPVEGTKNRGGRPPQGGPTTTRQLGRVPTEQWTELQEAATRSGQSFTRWAVEILLRAARRTKKARRR